MESFRAKLDRFFVKLFDFSCRKCIDFQSDNFNEENDDHLMYYTILKDMSLAITLTTAKVFGFWMYGLRAT